MLEKKQHWTCAHALVSIGKPAVQPLMNLLQKHGLDQVGRTCLTILGMMESDDLQDLDFQNLTNIILSQILKASSGLDGNLTQQIARIAQKVGNSAIKVLVSLLDDEIELKRRFAVSCLSLMDISAAKILLEELEHKESIAIIANASRCLIQIAKRDHRVIKLLVNKLKEGGKRRVMDVAVDVLVKICDEKILDYAFSILDSDDESAKRRIAHFIRNLMLNRRELAELVKIGIRELLSNNYERNRLSNALWILSVLKSQKLEDLAEKALEELYPEYSEVIKRYQNEIKEAKPIKDVNELRKVIEQGESLHVEFKETIPDNKDLAKEICAFANKEGGILILGVSDDGIIKGLKDDPKKVIERIENICRDLIDPRPKIHCQEFEYDGKILVVVRVAEGTNKPYWHKDGRCYIRYGRRAEVASRSDVIELVNSRKEE